jgi:hypothetical protein
MLQRWCVLAVAALLGGCYSHAYHRASPAAPNNRIAIDENLPSEAVHWSYFWGLTTQAPITPRAAECDGRGEGKVVVSTPWYGVPVSLVSLGIASPVRFTFYCTTDPGPPPVGP